MAQAKTAIEEIIKEALAKLLQAMGVSFTKFTIAYDEEARVYNLDIETDQASTLIGYHGEIIHALQQILKTIVWNKVGESIFVILDVDSYRKRQEESVKKLAKRKVEEARKTLEDQVLPPMSPYFRRIIHLFLAQTEYSDITTESSGEGERRQVIIKVHKVA